MNTPEFRYENKLDVIKAKDRDNLIEYLEMKEKQEEERRREEEEEEGEGDEDFLRTGV